MTDPETRSCQARHPSPKQNAHGSACRPPPQQINTDHYKITTKIAVPRLMFAITSGAVRGFKNTTVQLERRGNDRQ